MAESEAGLVGIRSFRVDGKRVDPPMLRVTIDGKAVRLEPRSMQLLVYLASHAGRVISRAELEEQVWGRVVGDEALTNSISKLRRLFGDDARAPRLIETLPKTGYRFLAQVDWEEEVPPIQAAATRARSAALRPSLRTAALILLAALLVAAAWMAFLNESTSQPETAGPVGEKPAVAILPFENLGARSDEAYFANGITIDLITDLARYPGLLVIAPGSVFSYQGRNPDGSQISRELDVDYVVRGSVQRQERIVRINVQLIQAASERALWAVRYEGPLGGVFEFQESVITGLVAALDVSPIQDGRVLQGQHPVGNPEAYDLFLRGLEAYGRRTHDSNESAKALFQQALRHAPDFARAIAGLALAHSRDALDGWTRPPRESLARAESLASRAATINPTIPQVHFVVGQVALFNREYERASAATRRAIALSPNYADAYALLAWILNFMGATDQAVSTLETAVRLNPIIPVSYSVILGEIRFSQGDYAAAIDEFRRSLFINPAHMRARMWLIVALAEIGDVEEMAWQVDELLTSHPGFSLAMLDYTFPYEEASLRERVLRLLRQSGLPD